MRSFPAIAAAIVLVACGAAPKADNSADKAAVEARSTALAQAEAAKDVNTAINFWSDDAIVQMAGGPARVGIDAVRKDYEEMFAAVKSFRSTATSVDVSGDLAWEHGVTDIAVATPNGEVSEKGKYLAVWKKINDEWYVVALSFTTDTPTEPAPATTAQ